MSNNLPTLQELHHAPDVAFKNDQLKQLLYQNPPDSWVKVNKYANNSKYISIGQVEFLLDRIFQKWRVEVLDYKQLFNSVSCHVRLHYVDPVSGEWTFHDGVGAADIQVKSGSSPAELANINKNAVGMALPISKSYAIKDACHHIGRVFGKDLNRSDTMNFAGAYSSQPTIADIQELFDLKKDSLSKEDIEMAERILKANEVKSFGKLFTYLMNK
jgi:hypothetical protein